MVHCTDWPWGEEDDTWALQLRGRPRVKVVVRQGSVVAASMLQEAQEKGDNTPSALMPTAVQADCRTAAGTFIFCCSTSSYKHVRAGRVPNILPALCKRASCCMAPPAW